MKKGKIIISILIIAIVMVACTNAKTNDNIAETFESIVETLATIPIETIIPTIAPTQPPETEPIVFNKNIVFTYEYVDDGDVMPYGLFTPSSAEENGSVPLIVWLHGGGERNCTVNWFANASLPGVLNKWELDGFNAYVICPHLRGKWNPGYWNHPAAINNVKDLIDKFSSEYNVDIENIIIAGHSLGGLGAMYIAIELPDYFNKMVVMSSLKPSHCDVSEIKIPSIGCAEASLSTSHFMNSEFAEVFGESNVLHYEAKHNEIPYAAFNEDKNKNNCSDIVEWMFDYKQ